MMVKMTIMMLRMAMLGVSLYRNDDDENNNNTNDDHADDADDDHDGRW